jgi:hypothetical protein
MSISTGRPTLLASPSERCLCGALNMTTCRASSMVMIGSIADSARSPARLCFAIRVERPADRPAVQRTIASTPEIRPEFPLR